MPSVSPRGTWQPQPTFDTLMLKWMIRLPKGGNRRDPWSFPPRSRMAHALHSGATRDIMVGAAIARPAAQGLPAWRGSEIIASLAPGGRDLSRLTIGVQGSMISVIEGWMKRQLCLCGRYLAAHINIMRRYKTKPMKQSLARMYWEYTSQQFRNTNDNPNKLLLTRSLLYVLSTSSGFASRKLVLLFSLESSVSLVCHARKREIAGAAPASLSDSRINPMGDLWACGS
ncbi:hypothetical protein FIBSPDRAFT_1021158 [Athelia psychrophila]|uniref:Uncharacterized protein n=1 Tax=Athelia psychrophila TaxID=1759441 RepID=A0A166JTG5_9AGAM|nr:hypothetical protein FIBSPDRAFT_1021158 [Fibularhizoctonia sp. CBS 109695]